MTVEMPPGPPCDGCGVEPAAMSLLSYGDYSQVKVGVDCAPNFLRQIADSIDGGSSATPPESEPVDPLAADTLEGALAQEAAELGAQDDGEPGSAADHWASTRNVVRSTHGHRTPKGATGSPRKDEPE